MTDKFRHSLMMKLSLYVVLSSVILLSACNETTAATLRPSSAQANPQLQLLSRVNSLESEISKLQNTVELQQNEINQLTERLSGIYDDFDRRMRSLENSSSVMMAPVMPATSRDIDQEIPSIPQQKVSATDQISPADSSVTTQDVNSAPVVPVDTMPTGNSQKKLSQDEMSQLEQSSYDRAFDLLKASRYEESIAAFKEFQTRYPRSSLSDSAQYWIAEARYVNRAYDAALYEYNMLIQRYPKSKRLSDAMLKIGYIHFDNEQWEQARRALNAVVIRYPSSRVAVSAKMRLEKMNKTGH